MAAGPSTEELLKRLDDQHKAYLETFKLVHEALSQNLSQNRPTSPVPASKRRRRSTLDVESEKPDRKTTFRTLPSSVATGDSDESDDDDELYVQEPLSPYKYDHENLRAYLKSYNFNSAGRKILKTVVQNGRLINPLLFPVYDPNESSHNSHYSVFDVGTDGAPLSRHEIVREGTTEIDSAIWQAIQDLNTGPAGQREAVGRISIIREPSPIIFGALHMTMNKHFDMDEIFKLLISSDTSSALILNRAFEHDPRRQRSFIFNFDYYTVIGDDCAPMPWQLTDIIPKKHSEHIPISRCSSIVALSLSGASIKKLKNAARRAKTQYGYVYDPWASWHVLNIQCYPDRKHSMDSHDSTKHYVNGPEAFLTTLLAEFKDAQKRFEDLHNRIHKLVTPPANFMFSSKARDALLFEDEEFTYSRRYFWAYQTLSTLKNGIKSILDSYEDTFTDDVWEGQQKSVWPILYEDSARNKYWRKRMLGLKKDFEKEVRGLKVLEVEIEQLRKEVRTLRDQLFNGTSVLESRKSVEIGAVTILQGHNIKLLTLVSIFFLPLTFVTSVFGMTNMPTEHIFKSFGIVMGTVCVPFFLLIGFLNTTAGMEYWRDKWHRLQAWFRKDAASGQPPLLSKSYSTNPEELARKRTRSLSTTNALNVRKAQVLRVDNQESSAAQKRSKPSATADIDSAKDDNHHKVVAAPASKFEPSENAKGVLSWWERFVGRKKVGVDHHV